MALPDGFLDDLLGRVSLARVVGRKVTWDPRKSRTARGDYWAACPFHQEKTASFHVDDAKGFYHCFGCQAKGDAVSFLRQSEGLGFIEAVEMLAREAGVPMPAESSADAARAATARGLAEAMEAAVQFYRLQLATVRAAEARAYLDRRGLSEAARARFEVGFAPDGRTALLDHLKDKGFALERLVEAGLVFPPTDGGPRDRFRNRIMFPIRDGRGRAIAFGARAVAPGQEPKYLNSPETPLFDKGRSLYNVGPARAAAAKTGTLIVAEGYMDVIALAEAGFGHAVAPLGTAITEAQLAALWKLAPEPVVALDGDDAGLNAAHRLIALALPLLAPGKALRFALMPADRDPDDVIRDGGAAAMQGLIDASRPMAELIWTRETEGQVFDSPERVAALRARLKAQVARIQDPGLRDVYDRDFRARFRALFAPPERPGRPPRRSAAPVAGTRATLLGSPAPGAAAEARIRESAVLAGCLNHPALAGALEDRLERMRFACEDLAEVRDALLSILHSGHDPVSGAALHAALFSRLGYNPLDRLMAVGQVRANKHLAPQASSETAFKAIDEALTRHAALFARIEEVQEAAAEISQAADDSLTARLRHASDAEWDANTRPLTDAVDDQRAEHRDFVAFFEHVEAQQAAKKPRTH